MYIIIDYDTTVVTARPCEHIRSGSYILCALTWAIMFKSGDGVFQLCSSSVQSGNFGGAPPDFGWAVARLGRPVVGAGAALLEEQ